MSSPIWEQIEQIFLTAADLPREQQASFLDEACHGDAGLRKEVQSLLDSDRKSGEKITRAVEDEAQSLFGLSPIVGSRLGAWRVIREIGRGGMGAVYLAVRDDAQFRKNVAIKLVKRDLDMQVTPVIFHYKGRELMVDAGKECRLYLMDTESIGGDDHRTPLYRSPLLCNEDVNFASAGIWGSLASWEDSKGVRWVLTPIWGPSHPDFKVPISYGPVTHGAIVALKVEDVGGKTVLTPAWMSRDMDQAEPPVIANGVVFAYGNGESSVQATPELGLGANTSANRIKWSTHAVLYALDAETGKELWSSGDQIRSWNYCFGISR